MGAIYLDGYDAPSLLEVVASTGVPTSGWAGWQTRSRSSGGYDPPGPLALICHHTASPARSTPGQQFANDASYCAVGHADAPVANMVLGPEGQVSVHAAGSSNHAGAGGPWSTSRGKIPQDGANSRTIAVEASNDGQGQPWSSAQQDAYVAITRAMAAAYGFRLAASDVFSHEEWTRPSCPGRKCDPAGPSRWAPKPAGGCSAGNLWNMDAFRASCANELEEEEDDMAGYLYQDTQYQNVFLLGQGPATSVPTEVLTQLSPKLGPTIKARHGQTLEQICWQAWGCDAATAAARRLLV
jgi:hypothetical protein